ncbi:unnamed protein product [Closterium sp. Naga37s-1]|nr:unnamed protein product [Closterium sp. Naga37s-1]
MLAAAERMAKVVNWQQTAIVSAVLIATVIITSQCYKASWSDNASRPSTDGTITANETFDVVASYSSLEHDGLGRYGDPLNPDGDRLRMMKASSQFSLAGMSSGTPLAAGMSSGTPLAAVQIKGFATVAQIRGLLKPEGLVILGIPVACSMRAKCHISSHNGRRIDSNIACTIDSRLPMHCHTLASFLLPFPAAQIRGLLKPGGLFFLGLPVGNDTLVFNAHRVYGPIRMPLLLEGWELLDVFGVSSLEAAYRENLNADIIQPVMVLK